MGTIKSWIQRIDNRLGQHAQYRVVRNAILGFNRREGSQKAAAMTYFALFSIFPFVLLLIVLLSFAVDSREAQARIMSLLSDFLPAGSTGAEQVIQDVIAARGTAAGFGLVLLLWGALGWFQSIDKAVNEMWNSQADRPFIKGKVFALAMFTGIVLVMLLSWLANIAVGILVGFAGTLGLNLLPGSAAIWDSAVAAVTMGLMFVIFLLLYRFSPMCDLSWEDVWKGALITAIVWSMVRSGFAIYVTHFANYSSAYGPIGAVIAFITWLYVAHMIILFGAALTYSMRLESHGIHGLRDLPCALPEEGARQDGDEAGERPAA